MIIQIAFYCWAGVSLLLLFPLFRFSAHPQRMRLQYLVGIAAWLTYVYILSRTGVLNDFGLPPRLPFLVILPTLLFALYVTGRAGFGSMIQDCPIYLPVMLQTARIGVELLIYAGYTQGVFGKINTFEGLNMDILSGISAIPVAIMLLKNRISKRGLLIWNLATLSVLALTIFSFLQFYIRDNHLLTEENKKLIEWPYLFLPALYLPIALFLHVFSIRQCTASKGTPS